MDPTILDRQGAEPDLILSNSNASNLSNDDPYDPNKSIVKQKEDELKAMQHQIETYNTMSKQLNGQRELAIRKLMEIDMQIEEKKRSLEDERKRVEAKEQNIKGKRNLLHTLKSEENELNTNLNQSKKELEVIKLSLANTQTTENLIKSKVQELNEFITTTSASLEDLEKAIEHKDTVRLSYFCNQVPQHPPNSNILTNGFHNNNLSINASNTSTGQLSSFTTNENEDSIFNNASNFDPFANDDPFVGDDPFKSEDGNSFTLPDDDPFNPRSAANVGFNSAFTNDPFAKD